MDCIPPQHRTTAHELPRPYRRPRRRRPSATVFAVVWEGGRWVLSAVKSATGVPTPVLPATDAAAAYLDAPAPAVAPSPYLGPAPRHQVGVPLVSYARHVVAGGPTADVSGLPEPVLAWARGLSHSELVTLGCRPPARG